MSQINIHRPAALPTTLPITLLPRGSLIFSQSERVTGNNIAESWEGLLICAIDDKNIDCFKASDVSLDLHRSLRASGAVLFLVG